MSLETFKSLRRSFWTYFCLSFQISKLRKVCWIAGNDFTPTYLKCFRYFVRVHSNNFAGQQSNATAFKTFKICFCVIKMKCLHQKDKNAVSAQVQRQMSLFSFQTLRFYHIQSLIKENLRTNSTAKETQENENTFGSYLKGLG